MKTDPYTTIILLTLLSLLVYLFFPYMLGSNNSFRFYLFRCKDNFPLEVEVMNSFYSFRVFQLENNTLVCKFSRLDEEYSDCRLFNHSFLFPFTPQNIKNVEYEGLRLRNGNYEDCFNVEFVPVNSWILYLCNLFENRCLGMSPSLNAKLCFEKLSGRITEFDVFEGSERIVSFRFSKPKKLLEKSSIPFIARMENCTQDSFYLEILPLKDMETKNIVLDFPSYVAENNLSKIEFKKMVPLKVKFHSKTPRLYHSGRVCWNERCYRVACNVKTSKHLGISSVPITLNDEFKNTGRNLKRYTINVSSISDYPYIFLKITGKNYGDPYPRLLWIKIDNVTVSPREGDYTWPVVSEIVDDDFSYEFEVSNLLEGKEKVVVEIGLTTYRGYWLISAKFVGENVLIV